MLERLPLAFCWAAAPGSLPTVLACFGTILGDFSRMVAEIDGRI
jgi:hypothetical protein